MHHRLGAVAAIGLLLVACSSPPAPGASPAPVETTAPTAAPTTASTAPILISPSAAETPAPRPLAWAELEATGPQAREDHTWTASADGRIAYLFGGRDGSSLFGDVWAYDLATDAWAQLDAGPGPEPRFGHEAVWVDGIGLVVFGGQAGATFFNDLWAFQPGTDAWRELPASGDVPLARYGSCAAIGPDGRLWISHGFTSDGTRFSDTRAYDFGTSSWTDETPDGGRPVERCLHGCWWTDDGELALYAGQTTGATALGDRWILAGGSWSRVDGVGPPDRNLYARTRLDAATLVFGGQAVDGGYLDDLWLLGDGQADAVRVDVEAGRPAPRAGGELIRDVGRQRVLLFGGRDAGAAFSDVWALTGDPLAGR